MTGARTVAGQKSNNLALPCCVDATHRAGVVHPGTGAEAPDQQQLPVNEFLRKDGDDPLGHGVREHAVAERCEVGVIGKGLLGHSAEDAGQIDGDATNPGRHRGLRVVGDRHHSVDVVRVPGAPRTDVELEQPQLHRSFGLVALSTSIGCIRNTGTMPS